MVLPLVPVMPTRRSHSVGEPSRRSAIAPARRARSVPSGTRTRSTRSAPDAPAHGSSPACSTATAPFATASATKALPSLRVPERATNRHPGAAARESSQIEVTSQEALRTSAVTGTSRSSSASNFMGSPLPGFVRGIRRCAPLYVHRQPPRPPSSGARRLTRDETSAWRTGPPTGTTRRRTPRRPRRPRSAPACPRRAHP